MPKVWCASIECKHNKNNQCKAKEINLAERNLHTVHEGFKRTWDCRCFAMDEETKRMFEKIKKHFADVEGKDND